jgi:hypothetical protein
MLKIVKQANEIIAILITNKDSLSKKTGILKNLIMESEKMMPNAAVAIESKK